MSLKGFENETAPLTDYERDVLLPVLVSGLKKKVGVSNAVTNKQIVSGMRKSGYEITEVRVRKLVNHIRTHKLLRGLIATSLGYYWTENLHEVLDYIKSLRGRESAIRQVTNEMEDYAELLQRRELLKTTQETIIIRHEQ